MIQFIINSIYHRLIAHAKRKFNAQLIQSSIPNPRLLSKNINSLLHS